MFALLSPLRRKREERGDRDGRENGETTLRSHVSGGMAKKKKKKSLAQKQTNEPQLAITCSNSGRPGVAEGFSGWHQRTESDLVGESYKESQGLSADYVAL